MKTSIFSHTSESYSNYIYAKLGRGKEHARLIYQEWFRTGSVSGGNLAFKNANKLLEEILEITDFSYLPLLKKGNEGGTEKYLLVTSEGFEVEMVVLPMRAGWTLCISSQVGCRMGCTFCETGKMGLLRNLSTEEILAQVFQAIHGLKVEIRNLVFMGMGEPFDNYDAVLKAIQILTDSNGFGFGPSRITVSTSGLVNGIYKLIEDADPALNLAVSINAPNNEVRQKLMPVNSRHDMEELRKAMELYCSHRRRRILIEYILIKGKTDSLEDAAQLANYLTGLNVTINLIPYNPQSKSILETPSNSVIDAFAKYLKNVGYRVFIRETKGQKIMAACGQLGNRQLRKRMRGSMVVS